MPAKPKFEPRKLMEMAIEVMRQSVNEPRDDGDEIPKVGAVLWKPDGTIETACRGELRYGDHAEFTLLERKNRSSRLDGSILFATLEPCAPGARNNPKLGCAEYIVNARIKEVWVGIEDPHPKVAGKGFEYLKRHGVVVNAFDRDLQEIIQQENAEFLARAEQKAGEEEKREEIVLSEYEKAGPDAVLDDLSKEALERYRSSLGVSEAVGSNEFRRRLRQQGLLEEVDGKLVPTGFGTLLFGKHPRASVPQAGLLATVQYPNGEKEIRDFDEALVVIPTLLQEWLQKTLALTLDRSRMQRQQQAEIPFEIIREAVVNALVHRDYAITGGKCQLVVTEDTITVKSPGAPLPPITLEQMKNFTAPMLSRNPVLHYVFSKMKLAEERGLGMDTWKTLPQDFGLPLPTYSFQDPYLILTLFRNQKGAEQALVAAGLERLTTEERNGWEFLSARVATTQYEYAKHFGVTARTAQRHLGRFVELGLLRRVGQGRATGYQVVRP